MLVAAETVMNPRREIVIMMCFAFAPQRKSHAILAHRARTPKSVANKFRVRCCILEPASSNGRPTLCYGLRRDLPNG